MAQKQLAQEYPPAGETEYIQNLGDRLKAKIIKDNPTGIMRRDAHPKMHGVVKAEFVVEPDLPEELRIGVFRESRTYQAWIRFSNSGAIQPDIKNDIRGMAIKLMGVPGQKILDQERNAQTQDFLVINTNIFIAKDVAEFDAMVKALAGGFFPTIWFFLTHLQVGLNILKASKKIANPLQIRYWSTTPYLYGKNAVKYSAFPQAQATDNIPANPTDDFLRQAMINQLSGSEVKFDFAIQIQTDADTMPIEDPTQAWNEAVAPFRKVATINILQQEFDSAKQREFGENLSFSPWHSLPDHRPLGGINRARKVVYHVISTFRHRYNSVQLTEPNNWNING
jgi:hypothetical protein